MTTEQIIKILRQKKEYFKEKYGVRKIAIFGSRARGDYTKESDLDILIELEKPISLLDLSHLATEIENLTGLKVDISTPKMINKPHLKESVEEDIINV